MAGGRNDGRNERGELIKASLDPVYFLCEYARIYDAVSQDWTAFDLWPAQERLIEDLMAFPLVMALKARQLGITWLCLGLALWHMLFRPLATVLFFSRRDDEAVHLLDVRLKGMYGRLPAFLQCRSVEKDNDHEWRLSNGSVAMAFPTTGGRSYTATLAFVDEADFAPDLNVLLNAVKPTIDAGGRLWLISTADKDKPTSAFKRMFRAALRGESGYRGVFLPWYAHPARSLPWYTSVAADMREQTGSDDSLWQEYPATVDEALAPKQMGKRLAYGWVQQCRATTATTNSTNFTNGAKRPGVPGLTVFAGPVAGRSYVLGADSAEGNPSSDPSAVCVLDGESWQQVAVVAGQFEPAVLAGYIQQVAEWYNGAGVLSERNNHGHALILALQALGVEVLRGLDGKPGWLSNAKGKVLLYDWTADCLRDGACGVADEETAVQLASLEAATLLAPAGEHEDRADAFALALAALRWSGWGAQASTVIEAIDILDGL